MTTGHSQVTPNERENPKSDQSDLSDPSSVVMWKGGHFAKEGEDGRGTTDNSESSGNSNSQDNKEVDTAYLQHVT